MKRAIVPALLLALLLAVPAIPQGDDGLEALTREVEQQKAQIETLEAYVAAQKAEALRLADSLKKAEREGFLFPAPHTDARKALLSGLQSYAVVASGGKRPEAAADEE